MDPTDCLLQAEAAISDGLEPIATMRLDNYVNWRGIGGFEPQPAPANGLIKDGDAFHRELIGRYEAKFGPYLDGRLPEPE